MEPATESEETHRAELLAWVAHMRFLNSLCSDSSLQDLMLSRYGGELSEKQVSLKQVLYAFPFTRGNQPEQVREQSVREAAQSGRGDSLDGAICFAALCRALKIRCRLVRSFWLAEAKELDKKTTSQAQDKEDDKDHLKDSRDLKKSMIVSNVSCWVEFFDGNSWVAVDPCCSWLAKETSGMWVHPSTPWMCAADDDLKGPHSCFLTDVTDRYHRREEDYIKGRLAFQKWGEKKFWSWWKNALEELSGELSKVRKPETRAPDPQRPDPETNSSPATPSESESLPQKRSMTRRKQQAAKKQRAETERTQKARRGLTGFPSLEPFEENARNLQNFLESRGVLPWLKSDNQDEKMLGRFVENLRIIKKGGKLSAENLELFNSWCPLWKDWAWSKTQWW